MTDHRTPLAERWGGWYVTGGHGAQTHRGNAVARDPSRPDRLDSAGARNLTDLARKTDTSRYLEPGSDIVALMVLEHQTQMTNHLTRLAWLARLFSSGRCGRREQRRPLRQRQRQRRRRGRGGGCRGRRRCRR